MNITPDTKVGELLRTYPQLEEELIALSPHFKALRNPVLRRTVAKVATLRQVAKVGSIPLGTLIGRLRGAAGQPPADDLGDESEGTRPDWASPAAATRSFDAREVIESGGHPMELVMADLAHLEAGQVYELVTPFEPAPLRDLARTKGVVSHSVAESANLVRTYFRR